MHVFVQCLTFDMQYYFIIVKNQLKMGVIDMET